MAKRLPIKLGKEPLIDAVFELRFSSKAPVSVILPGFLFDKLSGNKTIEQLPAAQVPKQLRDADSNLKFAPLTRVDWDNYFVNIGDNSVSVSCKYPYPGWNSFKSAIKMTLGILFESNIVNEVERYSMKYVDIIASSDDQFKVSQINLDVSIADHKLVKEPFQLRIEIPRDEFINAIHVISSAHAVLHNGKAIDGLIVDVDTFAAQNGAPIQTVMENIEEKLDRIHFINKGIFFDCLTPEAILSLDPVYE